MHPQAAREIAKQVTQRIREGDNPTHEAQSVEVLESVVAELYAQLEAAQGQPTKCKAGSLPHGEVQECDWPYCGCDPHANKVLAALEEAEYGKAPHPVQATQAGGREVPYEMVRPILYALEVLAEGKVAKSANAEIAGNALKNFIAAFGKAAPAPSAQALREALEQAEHTLSVHGKIDGETDLHNLIRATLAEYGK